MRKFTSFVAVLVLCVATQTSNVAAQWSSTVNNYNDSFSDNKVGIVNGNYGLELVSSTTSGPFWDRVTTDTYNRTFNGINDHGSGQSLFEYFNDLFKLTDTADAYTSSNQLFAERGVPTAETATWNSQYGTWLYSNKDANYTHTMNLTVNNQVVQNLYKYDGSEDNREHYYFEESDLVQINGGTALTNFAWQLVTSAGTTYTSGINGDGFVHMLAFDITDLLPALFGDNVTNYDKAYFIAWEDMSGQINTTGAGDWDYNDLMGIYINVSPNNGGDSSGDDTIITPPVIKDPSTATPEPATMLILGLGTLGAGLYGRRRIQK